MQSFISVLLVYLMTFYPVFALAKHNYIRNSNVPSAISQEEIEISLSFLDRVDEAFNQADQLENGNYQLAYPALLLIASSLQDTVRNLNILDLLQRQNHISEDSILKFQRYVGNGEFYAHVRPIRSSWMSYDMELEDLLSDRGSTPARRIDLTNGSSDLFSADSYVDSIHFKGEQGEEVFIRNVRPDRIPVNSHNRFSDISSFMETQDDIELFGRRQGGSAIETVRPDHLEEFFPKFFKVLRKIGALSVVIGLSSLVFANDVEASEISEEEEVAPVEITPEDLEQIQNDINTARDTLLSLL